MRKKGSDTGTVIVNFMRPLDWVGGQIAGKTLFFGVSLWVFLEDISI